jgi:hypothetical protein
MKKRKESLLLNSLRPPQDQVKRSAAVPFYIQFLNSLLKAISTLIAIPGSQPLDLSTLVGGDDDGWYSC